MKAYSIGLHLGMECLYFSVVNDGETTSNY